MTTNLFLFQMKTPGHPEDNHSDTSRETVTSDSGRGGSEDDLPVSHNNSKGRRFSMTFVVAQILATVNVPKIPDTLSHISLSRILLQE